MKTYQDLNNRHEFRDLKKKLVEIVSDHARAIERKLFELELDEVKTEDCYIYFCNRMLMYQPNRQYCSSTQIDLYSHNCKTPKAETLIEFLSVVRQVIDALDKLETEKCKDLQAALYRAIDLVCDKDEIEEEDE